MAVASQALDILKNELQNETDSTKFEKLVAALISRLLNVPIPVAPSGFQHGGDAGPAGQQGRRFRLECKKYVETTRLDERGLLGQIDQAVARDEALEAWILAATRTVPENVQQSLDQHGGKIGVPVLIIDWSEDGIPSLAALCASSPELVGEYVTTAATDAARAVRLESGDAIESLKRNMESWCLGFDSLRQESHERLDNIWNNPRESVAVFGQDVSGGSTEKKVKRKSVHDALDHWWRGPATDDAPAVVVGPEGVGKTWATLNWLVEAKTEQPVILTIPSSAMVGNPGASDTDLKRLLAERLYALTDVRSPDHWHRRLDCILRRPANEGPALTVWFDGLNQQPSVSWLNLLQVFQAGRFAGRIRVIVSTRPHHFENGLFRLKGLVEPAVPIEVGRYDAEPYGELEQMLAYEDLRPKDLRQDVLEVALTPRLFDLVVRFREQLGETGQITLHRILWEYGRETLGISFSEGDRKDWLKEIASQYRGGIREYSIRSLAETVNRPGLTEQVVSAHLSDIIDGRFVRANSSGDLELEPAIVAHALAIELLKHLNKQPSPSFETLDSELRLWLDPIAGFDQTAEILRAGVSILIEQGRGTTSASGVLLTAWLQAQNVTDAHRQEVVDLAPSLTEALLDAIENSDTDVHESARHWAVQALRAIPRNDCDAQKIIVERTRSWMGAVYRDIDTRRNRSDEQRKWRSDELLNLIGTHSAGPISVVGVPLNLVDRYPWFVKSTVPSILEDFPLRNALPTLEAAATALAAGDQNGCWETLKWICLLNEYDPEETARELRDLADRVRGRVPEAGIHPELPKRVAALLLRLTGCEQDDEIAAHINPDIGGARDYKRDYLSKPGRSLLPLERRHAHVVLQDRRFALQTRINRIGELWLDPTFEPPDEIKNELIDLAANIDVEKLNRTMGPTIHDAHFEETVPVLARFAPDLLADLIRRKLQSLETCPVEFRHWSAISATTHFLLSGKAEATAAQRLRLRAGNDRSDNEAYAASRLLMIEIRNLQGRDQVDALLQADLPKTPCDFAEVLDPLTAADVDTLLKQYASASLKQQQDLLKLLSLQQVDLTEFAWSCILRFTLYEDDEIATRAFMILNQVDAHRFGRQLLEDGWSWSPNRHFYFNHCGSDSLIEASSSVSFEELAPRLAPWRLLEASRRRGEKPDEVRLAAAIFGTAVTPNALSNLNLRPDFVNVPARMRSLETAAARIDEARRKGVELFPVRLDWEDFKIILDLAPVYVEQWLNGSSGSTAEFEHRVVMAAPLLLALCEVLLVNDPDRGALVWRHLYDTTTTQVVRRIQVVDLIRLAFRVPDSPAVIDLRTKLVEQKHSRSDAALFGIALAASENDKTDWLNEVIENDTASPFVWRQRRATVLEGFRAHNSLPVAEAWPDSELKTTNSRLNWLSARARWIEACARHWWKSYLDASDPATAYAAWVLFLRSADSRCRVWMREDIDAISEKDDFFEVKMTHVRLNRDELNSALKKRAKAFDKNFLYRKITEGIGPWT